MMSIFITGIAGMLGSNMAYLLKDKYHVYGVDLHGINMKGVKNYLFSVFDTKEIKRILQENNIDYLIHCAALVNVDECEIKKEYAYKINYYLTKELVNICRELNIPLIYISTDAVFDGKKSGLYKETDQTGPISIYGLTKLMGEEAVLAHSRNLVIRTNIYGFNYREKKSFGEWIVTSLLSNIELNMFYDIYFSPILVNELAIIIDLCMKKEITGLYHVASTGSISKYHMALAIMEEFKINGSIHKVSMENYEFKAPRTKNMGLCNEKISRTLGIYISTPLEGVKEFKRLYDDKYEERLRKDESCH